MAVQFRQVPSIFILVTLALQACGGGSGSSEQGASSTTPAPLDTTAPIITLAGLASVEHEQGTTYVDAGASATDNVDGCLLYTSPSPRD